MKAKVALYIALATIPSYAQSTLTVTQVSYTFNDMVITYFPTGQIEPLSLSVSGSSSQVNCNLDGYWYLHPGSTFPFSTEYGNIEVKVNGSSALPGNKVTFTLPVGRPLIPNISYSWSVPESSFNMGSNTLEFKGYCTGPYTQCDSFSIVYEVIRS